MAGILVPPFKPSGTDSIIPRSTTITKIFGNTGGFSLSVGGTAASTAQLDVIAASSSVIGEIIKGASSQSANLLELQDNSANILTKFDSTGLLTLANSDFTSASGPFLINATATITLTNGTTATNGSRLATTFTYNTTQSGSSLTGYSAQYIAQNATALSGGTLPSPVGFSAAYTVRSDTNATSASSSTAFTDVSVSTRANSGTLAITNLRSFFAAPTINTGVTVTTRYGLQILDTIGSGTVSTVIGVDIADFSATATTKIGIRQSGTNAHNQIQGKTSLGALSAPTAQLDVVSNAAATIGQIIKGASSQSANLLELQDSSANVLTKFSNLGFLTLGNTNSLLTESNSPILSIRGVHDPGGSGAGVVSTLNVTTTYTALSSRPNGALSFQSNGGGLVNDTSLSNGTVVLFAPFYITSLISANTNTFNVTEYTGFRDRLNLSATNSGILNIATLTSFVAAPAGSSGTVNVTTRRGVWVKDSATITLTTNIGLDIDDLATGTTKIGIRQTGTNAHNQIQGDTSFGQLAAPSTSKVQIVGDTTTNRVLTLKAASSQSANIFDATDNSNNVLTSLNSSGDIGLLQTASTFSGTRNFISTAAVTHTINNPAAISGFIGQSTFNHTVSNTGLSGSQYFQHNNTYKNASSMTGTIGIIQLGFYNSATYTADTNATTMGTVAGGFYDNPTFSRVNSGTLTSTEWFGFRAAGTSATGVTITTRYGLHISNIAGGTITNHYGIVIDDLANAGGTTTQALRVLGTTAHSRHVPKIKVGADAAPNVDVDINGAVAYGKSTISLTADNQVVSTANISYISLSSNNGTPANRDFVLTQSTVAGQRLIIEWTGTNAAQLIDDSAQNGGGNHRLSANWVPTQYDTISFISNGTDWIETGRSTN